jgi:P27 family predicted phage terminase small subunit
MDCPAWVKSDARDHWGEIAPMLEGMGIGSPLYTPALALLVNSLGRYIEYERRVDEVGPTCETEKGNLIVHPVWAARNKAWDQVLKALREFGMTPVAVSRLATEARSKDDHGGIGDIINPKLRIA